MPDHAVDADWCISFEHYDPEDERRRESLLSLGNGRLHTRSSICVGGREGDHYPATYAAGLYDLVRGKADDQPIEIESLVRLPEWRSLRLHVDGEELGLDPDRLAAYCHSLSFRDGATTRQWTFVQTNGNRTRFEERLFVSLARSDLLALELVVTPLNWSGTIALTASLDGGVRNEAVAQGDGYDPEVLQIVRRSGFGPDGMTLVAQTRGCGTRIRLDARTILSDVGEGSRHTHADEQVVSQSLTLNARESIPLSIVKLARYSIGELAADDEGQPLSALPPFRDLLAEHMSAWSDRWSSFRIACSNTELDRALKLHAFHILQTATSHSAVLDAGFPSRGWQEAYHGQIFWDDLLAFPLLAARCPDMARAILLYRHRRLDAARMAASAAGLRGAMFPWRSAHSGQEVTPAYQKYSPSNHWVRDETFLQRHIGSAIVYNVWTYLTASDDQVFAAREGADLILEVARFWASLAAHDPETDRFSLHGVSGPDEYHTHEPDGRLGLSNNTYTNLMASWVLQVALDLIGGFSSEQRAAVFGRLQLSEDECRHWDHISRRLTIPFDENGLVMQSEGFEDLLPFDTEAYDRRERAGRLNEAMEAAGLDINRYRVLKQADLAMALYLLPLEDIVSIFRRLGYPISAAALHASVQRDRHRTVHESSLSDLVYAGALAAFDPEASWDIYKDAIHPDEKEGHADTDDGVHLGAMAATLDILQRRYLGLIPTRDGLRCEPHLPASLGRIELALRYQGTTLTVVGDDAVISIAIKEGGPVQVVTELGRATLFGGKALQVRSQANAR